MLALALADERRASQDDRDHRDLVDDLRQSVESGLVERRVEQSALLQIDGGHDLSAVTVDEFADLAHHHLLDVATSEECLAHACGMDVELDFGAASGQFVALKIDRDVQHEGVAPIVHALVRGFMSKVTPVVVDS